MKSKAVYLRSKTTYLIHRRVGGEEIKVGLTLDIDHVDALGMLNNDRDRVVVVGTCVGESQQQGVNLSLVSYC